MHRTTSRAGHGRRLLATAALVLGTALSTSLAGASVTPIAASAEQTAASRAPGRWVSFRTTDSGAPPRPAHTRACREHLGEAFGNAVLVELEADLFSFTTRRATGVVDDETARLVGHGYICASGPDPTSGNDPATLTSYARVRLPEAGFAESVGGCETVPSLGQAGSALFNCRLRVLPDPSRGVVGGYVTSNSVLNPAQVPGNATGSIWTAYVQRTSWPDPDATDASAPTVPGKVAGDVGGGPRVGFVSARGEPHPVDDPTCSGRRTRMPLHRVQADLDTSVFRPTRRLGTRVGRLGLCEEGETGQVRGTLVATGPAGDRVTLRTVGTCRTRATGGRRARVCTLQLAPDVAAGVQGGFVTTIGPASATSVLGRAPIVTAALLPLAP